MFAGLFQGDDSQLLTVGGNQADGREANLIVETNVLIDVPGPPAKFAFQRDLACNE